MSLRVGVRGHGKAVPHESDLRVGGRRHGVGGGVGVGVLLAEDDSILEAIHEVVPYAAPGGSLDPHTQLTFRLWVVFLCQLREGNHSGGGDRG